MQHRYRTLCSLTVGRLARMILLPLIVLVGCLPAFAQGQSSIRVFYPNGGETLVVDSTVQIRWLASGVSGQLTIEYSADSGSTWTFIDTVTARTGFDSLAWQIPLDTTRKGLVRISSGTVNDVSNNVFTISTVPPRTLTVLYPNGGQLFKVDSTITIRWTGLNVTGTLSVEYSADGGTTWESIGTKAAVTGADSLVWVIPNDTTTRALVRVRTSDSSVQDASNAVFSIKLQINPSVKVSYPNGGEVFAADSTVRIRWEAEDMTGLLTVQYSADSGKTWKPVGNKAVRIGPDTLAWKVPNDPTTHALVRVGTFNASVSDTSDMIFTITARPDSLNPTVTVLYPNGAEVFAPDSTVQVQWRSRNLSGQISAQLSIDGGTSWQPIGNKAARDGLDTLAWKVPNVSTQTALIRISNGQGAAVVRDTSDATFTITGAPDTLNPTVTVLYPNGNETFMADSSVTVRWQSQDIVGQLVVQYSVDGKTWKAVGNKTARAGLDSLVWKVPDDPSTTALLRIGTANGSLRDTCNAYFTILAAVIDTTTPSLKILYPNGGERFPEDTSIYIRWRSIKITSRIFVAYSINGGGTWTVIDSLNPTSGVDSLLWKVPAQTSQNAYILVSSVDGAIKDASDNGFRVILAGSSSVDPSVRLESGTSLVGVFPNPASSGAEIRWRQSVPADVSLRLIGQDGRAVRTVDGGHREAGSGALRFNLDGLSSGTYLYELHIGSEALTGIMTVVR